MKQNLVTIFSFITGGQSIATLMQKSTPILAYILLCLSIVSLAIIIRLNWKQVRKTELDIENKELDRELKENYLEQFNEKTDVKK